MPDPRFGPTAPLIPPLYTSVPYVLPDLDALDDVYEGRTPGYIYARDAHPNAHGLAERLAKLEAAAWGVVCGSGMASLSAAFLALVSGGDTILASSRLYGRTTKLLRQEFHRFGVKTVVVDTCDLDATRTAVEQHKPKVVFAETQSNPLCRVPDVPALAEVSHAHGAKLLIDNTFATPVL